jgi:hypothetical protein
MIAVFTETDRDFNESSYSPISLFKRIRSERDIIGIKFTGLIVSRHWIANNDSLVAYESLKLRQPELFEAKHDRLIDIANSSTYSPIGSHHWFFTHIGRIKRIGEFMKEKGTHPKFDQKEKGSLIFNICCELAAGFEFINKN